MDDLWEDAYTCPIYAVKRTTEAAIYVMELTVRGGVPILGSTARNSDWWFFIDTILRLLYTNPTSKSQTNDSYDYEKFIIVIILNNVSVCRSKTWYKVEDMISKFSASSAGDSILMNNSMHGAFDLTDIFCIPTCEKINRKSTLCIEKNNMFYYHKRRNRIEHQRWKNLVASGIWCGTADWVRGRSKISGIWSGASYLK